MATTCLHLAYIRDVRPSSLGCEECLAAGGATGFTCDCVSSAVTWAAVTARPVAMPPSTSTQPATPLSARSNQVRTGSGATWARSCSS